MDYYTGLNHKILNGTFLFFLMQEATMEFAPEESDDEANAVANSIAAACVPGSDRSSIKDLK